MPKPPAPALLAPSWSTCLCGPAAGPGRRANRQALLFDLEGRLPVAAEGLAADFLPLPETPGAAWGVAAPAEGLGPAVAALEEGGTPPENGAETGATVSRHPDRHVSRRHLPDAGGVSAERGERV